MNKLKYSTFDEKVAAARKGLPQSAVTLYSVPQKMKFETRPATISADGFPQLVHAFSPKQVQQYKDLGFAVYQKAAVADSLKVEETSDAPKRTRKTSQGDE